MSAIVLWLGLALLAIGGALYYVERTRPGKLAALIKAVINQKGTQ